MDAIFAYRLPRVEISLELSYFFTLFLNRIGVPLAEIQSLFHVEKTCNFAAISHLTEGSCHLIFLRTDSTNSDA